MEPKQLLCVTVDLGVMAMKGYSTLPRSPKLELRYQRQFSVIPRTPLSGRVFYSLAVITSPGPSGSGSTCTCIGFHPGWVESASSRASTAYRCLCCSLKKVLWDLIEGRVPSPTQKNNLFAADFPETH